MGCAVGTVKFAVFIFNFLLVCLGFAMVLFGAMDSAVPKEIEEIPDMVHDFSITSKILIVAGSIIFVVAFFGCWGAVSDSSCMLFLYALFLMALILVEAGIGVYVYVHRDTIKGSVSKQLKEWISEYPSSSKPDSNVRIIVDNLQQNLHCCGVDGPSDWKTTPVPGSCCDGKPTVCNNPYKKGCLNAGLDRFNEKFKKHWYIIGGILGVEVATIVFALIVRNSILNDRRRSLA